MDSGIESTHPEFEGVDISYLYTVTPNDYSDHRGHGTSLASVISGKTCGITNAKLKIVKIYENNHQTLQSEILDALDAILSDVPANHFALVNCSWVIDKNEWVEYKMREMTQRGIWVICAAGNNGTSIEDVTPASMTEAFTVGAYNQDLLPCDFSDYTGPLNTSQSHVNHGELDGWAPGENIYAALLNGSYGIISGTSIATAIMTAVGAYNFSDDLYADGAMNEVLRGIAPVGPDGAAARLCSRYDLLDLSDPKYQNSVNRIATYAREVQPTPPPDEFSTVAIAGQRKNLVKIFEPSLTKSFTFNTPVPANFYIMNSGLLYGEPTVEQGPDVNQSYVLHNLEATRVDINDVTEIIKIDLYVVRNNYQPADLPQDHAINITLAGQCSAPCGTWGCAACYLISNSPCNNDCSFACCDTGKSAMCNCVA
jgi:hypothetical protein